MTFQAWLWVGIVTASIYWLLQIGLQVKSATIRLRTAIAETTQILEELQNIPAGDIPRAIPSSSADHLALVIDRRNLMARRVESKRRRQRRLVDRIEKLISEGGKAE